AAIGILDNFFFGKLQTREFANIRGGDTNCMGEIWLEGAVNRNADGRAFVGIELARIFEQRFVAASANVFKNRCDDALGFVQAVRLARDQRAGFIVTNNSNHYITILFNGYSTMPCAPASFRRGMMERTVLSSRIVFTASQSSSLR